MPTSTSETNGFSKLQYSFRDGWSSNVIPEKNGRKSIPCKQIYPINDILYCAMASQHSQQGWQLGVLTFLLDAMVSFVRLKIITSQFLTLYCREFHLEWPDDWPDKHSWMRSRNRCPRWPTCIFSRWPAHTLYRFPCSLHQENVKDLRIADTPCGLLTGTEPLQLRTVGPLQKQCKLAKDRLTPSFNISLGHTYHRPRPNAVS